MRKLSISAIFIIYTFVFLPEIFGQPVTKMEWDETGIVRSVTSINNKELSPKEGVPLLTLV